MNPNPAQYTNPIYTCEHLQGYAYAIDINGKFISCNAALCELFDINNVQHLNSLSLEQIACLLQTSLSVTQRIQAHDLHLLQKKTSCVNKIYSFPQLSKTKRSYFRVNKTLLHEGNKIIGLRVVCIPFDVEFSVLAKQITKRRKLLHEKIANLSHLKAMNRRIMGEANLNKQSSIIEYADRISFFYDSIIANVPGSLYWKDLNCTYLGGNWGAVALANTGTRENLRGKTDYDFARELGWDQNVVPSWQKDDKTVMETGEPRNNIVEPPFLRPDGSTIYQLANKVPLRDQDGMVVGILGISFDITKLRETEHELQQALIQNKILLNCASNGIFGLDSNANISFINASGAKVLGYEADQLIGKSAMQFLDSETIKRIQSNASNISRFKTFCTTQNQRKLPIEIDTVNVDNVSSFTKVITFKDITEYIQRQSLLEAEIAKRTSALLESNTVLTKEIESRKKIESELLHAQQRYRNLTRIAPVGILYMNNNGECIYLNEHAAEIIGMSIQQLQATSWFGNLYPQDKQLMLNHWQNMLEHGATFKAEFRFKTPYNKPLYALCRTMIYNDVNAGQKVYVFALTDITKLRDAELQLQSYKDKVAHTHRINTVGEMVLGIAHEINQPLMAIMQYTGGCIRRLQQANTNPDIIKALYSVSQQAERAGNIIHQLKALLRPTELCPSMENINDLLAKAIHFAELDIANHNITIDFDIDQSLPNVIVDQIQMTQVFINLLSNSIDAFKSCYLQENIISIKTSQLLPSKIHILFSDNGSGIEADKLQRIFEPFFTSKKGSMGMGLSITRSLLESQGGTIGVESTPGIGTTFTITLPVKGH